MAKGSLSKTTHKLNLTRRQTLLFQQIILAGNQMAELLAQLEFHFVQPMKVKKADKLIKHWSNLMIRLVNMLM